MVALVSGNSLGLSLTSLSTLGQQGLLGSAAQGRNGEAAYVNIANGNLVLQARDERLVGQGLDVSAVRTYNSQGLLNDDNGDNWSNGIYGQQIRVTGTLGAAGSTVVRTDRDGAEAVFAYSTTRGLYVNTDGAGTFDTVQHDAANSRLVFTDGASGLVERYQDSGAGRLLSSLDTSGNSLTYGYDANGKLERIDDANGETTFFDYASGNLTQVRTVYTANSVSTTLTRVRYTYDASNRLTQVKVDLTPGDNSVSDGATYTTSYTYDGSSRRIASVSQSDGTSLAITYVQVGADYRIASLTDALSQTTQFSYDTTNRQTTVTDPLGLVTVYGYDTAGQLVQVVAPAVGGVSQTTTIAWDADGNVVSITDPKGLVTAMAYDAQGNQILRRDGAGNTVTRTFDATTGQLLTETVYLQPDPDGAGSSQPGAPLTTRFAYDSTRHLRFAISAEGRVTEHQYNSAGQRTKTIQYNSAAYDVSSLGVSDALTQSQLQTWAAAQDKTLTQVTAFTYDPRGQLSTTTTFTATDSSGNGVTNGAQAVTQYVYDQAGLLLSTIAAGGAVTSYTYDGLGRLLLVTDAASGVTATQYDDANHRTVVTLASGLVTTSVYDLAGRLVTVSQSNAQAQALGSTQYFYDADGRLRMTQDPTGVRNYRLYDAAGRLVAEIDSDGTLTEHVFDLNNQVTQSVTYATAVSVAALVDGSGNPTAVTLATLRPSAAAQDARVWRVLDAAGRLVKTVNSEGRVSEFEYDGASRLVRTLARANTISVSGLSAAPTAGQINPTADATHDRVSRSFYDADGLLRATLDAEGYLVEYRYNALGQAVERVAYANATPSAERASGTLAALTPATHAQDQHAYTLYNARGQVVGQVDALGYLTETVYNTNGLVTQTIRYATAVTYSAGATLASLRPAANAQDHAQTFAYNALNQLTSETNAEGTVTTYSYNSVGQLLSSVRASGTAEARTLTRQYDIQGRLVAELSAEGAALLTGGQTQGQIDAIWAGHALHHTYDAAGRRTSTTDALGHKTLFYFDTDGRLTHAINALGEVTLSEYDTLNRQVASTSLATRVASGTLAGLTGGLVNTGLQTLISGLLNAGTDSRTTYTYNTVGEVTAQTDALGNTSTLAYNAFGQVSSQTTPVGASQSLVQAHAYDRRGQLLTTTQDAAGLNVITQAVYDAFGRLTQSTDANGQVRQTQYDRLGRVIATVDPLNAQRTSSFDAFSRVLTQTDANGHSTSYAYSHTNRSITLTTAEGVVVTTVHNRHGQTQSVTDGRGNTTSYVYDRDGHLKQTDRPIGSTSSAFDAAGRLVETTDANGHKVAYTYDAANRVLTRRVDPTGLNLTVSYTYDAKGQQVSMTDANGVVTTTAYDRKGQVLTQTVDPTGLNLATVYAYNKRGQTTSVTTPGGLVTVYTFDVLGRRIQEQVDPTGLNLTRQYSYDDAGYLVGATDANGQLTRYVNDANGQLVYEVGPTGSVRHQEYDAQGLQVRTRVYAQAISLTGLATTPTAADIAARVVATPARDASESYVYDADNRLRFSMDGTGGVSERRYDAAGNVVESIRYATPIATNTTLSVAALQTAVAGVASTPRDQHQWMVYDALNRVTWTANGVGAVTQNLYDANGNRVRQISYATAITPGAVPSTVTTNAADRSTWAAYDAAGRLAFQVDAAGAVTRWTYDANGQVVKQTAYDDPLTSVSDGSLNGLTTAVSADPDHDRVSRFAYDAAGRQVYSLDGLGNVVKTSYDANSQVVERRAYEVPLNLSNLADLPTASALDTATQALGTQYRSSRSAYDAAGRAVYQINALGHVAQTSYDAAGRVTQTKSYATAVTLGSAFAKSDVDTALSSQINNADNRIVSFTYDAVGRLASSTDALGFTESFTWDGAGNKLTFTNKKGSVWTYGYDAAGRLVQEDGPAVDLVAVTTDGSGNLVVDTGNSASQVSVRTVMTYDTLGQLLSRTEASGRPEQRTTSYEYDAVGHQVRTIYPAVNVYNATADNLSTNGATGVATRTESENVVLDTVVVYNVFGEAVANRDVSGQWSYKAYDRASRVKYAVDAEGYVTGYLRNTFGDALQVTRYGVKTTLPTNQANAPSVATVETALAALQHGQDRVITHTYDRLGRVTQVEEPMVWSWDTSGTTAQGIAGGKTTVNVYNSFGEVRLQSVLVNPTTNLWAHTRHYFDKLGQEVAMADAMGYITTRSFDAAGNVTQVREYATASASVGDTTYTTPATHADDRVTQYAYDKADRKTSETKVNIEYSASASSTVVRGDATTSYLYDAVGNLTRTTDALGNHTYSYYDALGRVTAVAAPSRTSTTNGAALIPLTEFRRDAHGNVLVRIDRANTADLSGATPTVVADAADRTALTRYDSHGHAIQTTDAENHSRFASYNAAGNLAKEWHGVSGYDNVMRTEFKAYSYDKLGQVTQVVTPDTNTVTTHGVNISFNGDGNKIDLAWSTLVDQSGGQVKIEVTVVTPARQYWNTDESGNPTTPYNVGGTTLNQSLTTTAAAAVVGATVEWTPISAENYGIATVSMVKVSQMNGAGQWVQVYYASGTIHASSVQQTTVTATGTTSADTEYNAFGEVARKGIDGGWQETFAYDNSGRMWRDKTAEGATRIYLHDMQGHVTGELLGADANLATTMSTIGSAELAHALSGTRRTESKYDLLGRVTQKQAPQRNTEGVSGANEGVSTSMVVTIGVPTSATPVFDESGTLVHWTGANSVGLSWSSLAALGSGVVKIRLDYSDGAGTNAANFQEWVVGSADTGTTLSWYGPAPNLASWQPTYTYWYNIPNAGITAVTRLQVWKETPNGTFAQVIDTTGSGSVGERITVPKTADMTGNPQLQYRLVGAGSWQTASLTEFLDAWSFSTKGLPLGSYEYQVLYGTIGASTPVVKSSGTFNLSLPTLSAISSAPAFASSTNSLLSWTAPTAGTEQIFNYRAAGSTGAWSSMTPVDQNNGKFGVNFSSIAGGTYEYELLYRTAGQAVPNYHAVGQITVTNAVASVWVPPVNLPPITTTLTINSTKIQWAAPATGTTVVFRYKLNAGDSWTNMTVANTGPEYDESGNIISYGTMSVTISGLSSVSRFFELLYTASGSSPTSQRTGSFTKPSTITNTTPAYTAGYWTTATPKTYSRTVTTQANTAAISLTMAQGGQAGSLTVGTTTTDLAKPIANYGYDRWGNMVTMTDWRSQAWVTMYRYNAANQLVEVFKPNSDGSHTAPSTSITATDWHVSRESGMSSEVGYFIVDDASGRIGSLLPGNAGYAAAALAEGRATTVFSPTDLAGTNRIANLPSGTYLGFYLIQNQTIGIWRQTNSANAVGGTPLAFFSFQAANPENTPYDHLHASFDAQGRMTLAWEDVTGGGDADFNDVVVTIGGLQAVNSAPGVMDDRLAQVANRAEAGSSSKVLYDKMGRQVGTIDALGNTNLSVLDAAGQLRHEVHADHATLQSDLSQTRGVVSYAYNAFGDKVRMTDAMGNVTDYAYDNLSRLEQVQHAAVARYSITATTANVALVGGYDEYGTPLYTINTTVMQSGVPNSLGVMRLTESYVYDQNGRRIKATNGDGEETKYVYDLRGNLVRTVKPLGQASGTAWDSQGRKIAEVDANGMLATWTYDYFGRLSAHTDIGGARYSYTYDGARQLLTQTSTRGQSLAFTYDAAGQLVSVVDSQIKNGSSINQVTTYKYDLAGNRIVERLTQGGTIYQDNRLAYDALGRLRLVEGLGGLRLQYGYDLNGNRLVQEGRFVENGVFKQHAYHYAYDKMNRQVLVDGVAAYNPATGLNDNLIRAKAVIGSTVVEAQGHILAYDHNGNRISDRSGGKAVTQSGSTYTGTNALVTERYYYDAMDRLAVSTHNGSTDPANAKTFERRYYDGASRLVRSGARGDNSDTGSGLGLTGEAYTRAIGGTTAKGYLDAAKLDATTATYLYDDNGQLRHQRVISTTGAELRHLYYTQLDAAGSVRQYVLKNLEGQAYTNQYDTTLTRLEGYKEGVTKATSTYFQAGQTSFAYDKNGFLTGVDDATKNANDRTLVNNAAGQVLHKLQDGKTQRTMIAAGQQLAVYGEGMKSPELSPTYEKVNASSLRGAPGAYVVAAGDTMRGIAQTVYGTAQLWWKIAEANGLTSDADLTVDQVLSIPAEVGGTYNSAGDFRPYDAASIVGDTTPNMPPPPDDDCGVLGQIIMIIVAIVVTYLTAGALSGGVCSVGAGGTAFGAAGVLTPLGAATAAVAGSIASQVVGNAIGAVDGFSWKAVALAGLSGGITQGFGGVNPFGTEAGMALPNTVARSMIANAATQGIAVATGLQDKFSWTNVAAAGIGAGVGQVINEALLGEYKFNADSKQWAPSGGTEFVKAFGGGATGAIGGLSGAGRFVAGVTSGFGAGVATAVAHGGRINITQIAGDAFGNALGGALVDEMAPKTQGTGAWSDTNYVNEMDRASDNYNPAFVGGHRNGSDIASDAYHPSFAHNYRNEADKASDDAYNARLAREANVMDLPGDPSQGNRRTAAVRPGQGSLAAYVGIGLHSFAYTSRILQGAGTDEGLWFSPFGIAAGAGIGLERGSAYPRTTDTLFTKRTAEFFFKELPANKANVDPTNPADIRRFYEWSETLRDLDRDVAKDLAVRRDVYVERVEALAKKYAVSADAPLEVVEQNARQAVAERNAIMEETRSQLTDKGKNFSEAVKPEGKTYEQMLERNLKGKDPSTVTETELIEANKKIIQSSGTPNKDITDLAKRAADLTRAQRILAVAENGGKVLGVVGAAADGYSLGKAINRSVEIDSADPAMRESTRIAGGWTGAWAGAKLGAAGGTAVGTWVGTAVFPVVGTATGAAMGAAVGALVGGVGGYIGGSNVATTVYDTTKSWMSTAKGWFK